MNLNRRQFLTHTAPVVFIGAAAPSVITEAVLSISSANGPPAPGNALATPYLIARETLQTLYEKLMLPRLFYSDISAGSWASAIESRAKYREA